MSRLAWKAHLRAVVIRPDHLVLLSEHKHHLLQGDAYVRAAPLLDGSWSDDEIHARLERDGVPSMSAWLALSHLRALGLLREKEIDRPQQGPTEDGETAFWESLGEDAAGVASRLSQQRVVLRDAGGTGVDTLRDALSGAGLEITGQRGFDDLSVVVADDFLDPRLEAINQSALGSGRAWMLVKLAGTVPWIGPLFVPGHTGCWACLTHRLRLNRQTEQVIEDRLGPAARAPLPARRSSLMLAAEFVAVELLRWLATGRHDGLVGGLLTLDLRTNSLTRHAFVRRPQCPVCGDRQPAGDHWDRADGARVELLPSPKNNATGGRSESPEAILARLEPHVSAITGVIRLLEESNDSGHVTAVAAQAFPMYRYNFQVLHDNLLSRSGGKGLDPVSARATAVCEALERFSGIWQGEEERTVAASRRELGDNALDPLTLFGFSARQLGARDAWNDVNEQPSEWVPKPFDNELTIDWVPLRSLTRACTRLAPAAYCYYGHPDLRHMFCGSDSNGCAAGGTLTEAVAHGLLELIERDAAGIWWYNRSPRPAVDLDSFALPLVDQLRELYEKKRRAIWALDLTTDIGVPVIAALSARLDNPVEDIIYGFGSDFNASAAVTKALLEMNQSLYSVSRLSAGGSTRYRTGCHAARRWFQSATRANQPYLVADHDRRPQSRTDFSWVPGADWREDIEQCVQRLRHAGLETFVLDQTRPDIGLPVCRVVVPGLCHFWRRFGTRRLYEAPVKMGWQASPNAEGDLNSWLIYF